MIVAKVEGKADPAPVSEVCDTPIVGADRAGVPVCDWVVREVRMAPRGTSPGWGSSLLTMLGRMPCAVGTARALPSTV